MSVSLSGAVFPPGVLVASHSAHFLQSEVSFGKHLAQAIQADQSDLSKPHRDKRQRNLDRQEYCLRNHLNLFCEVTSRNKAQNEYDSLGEFTAQDHLLYFAFLLSFLTTKKITGISEYREFFLNLWNFLEFGIYLLSVS